MEKKILAVIAICLALVIPMAMPAFAADFSLKPDCDPTLSPGQPGACNIEAFVALVKKIINYLFVISIPIAVGFIVYGAFVMITSGGNPAGFQNGKKVVVAAIIGIIIMLTASLLVSTLVAVLKTATQ